jgi:hypothetical protein
MAGCGPVTRLPLDPGRPVVTQGHHGAVQGEFLNHAPRARRWLQCGGRDLRRVFPPEAGCINNSAGSCPEGPR